MLLHLKNPLLVVKHLHACTHLRRGRALSGHLPHKQHLRVLREVSNSDQKRGREIVGQFVFNRAPGMYAGYLAGLLCFMLASGSVPGMETWEGLCVVRS